MLLQNLGFAFQEWKFQNKVNEVESGNASVRSPMLASCQQHRLWGQLRVKVQSVIGGVASGEAPGLPDAQFHLWSGDNSTCLTDSSVSASLGNLARNTHSQASP